jgi:hypothetical protein
MQSIETFPKPFELGLSYFKNVIYKYRSINKRFGCAKNNPIPFCVCEKTGEAIRRDRNRHTYITQKSST